MPNAIGTNAINDLSFGSELKAAGLTDLDFSFGSDGTFNWGSGVTEIQKAAVLATYTKHDPDPLKSLKDDLSAIVDARAEDVRLRLITPGSGQAMEYQEAYNEAVQVDAAYRANANATFDPENFPMLIASMGCDVDPKTGAPSSDIPGEARAVLAAYGLYQKAGAAIRGARLKGKAAIAAALSADDAQLAFASIVWPSVD